MAQSFVLFAKVPKAAQTSVPSPTRDGSAMTALILSPPFTRSRMTVSMGAAMNSALLILFKFTLWRAATTEALTTSMPVTLAK